MNLEEKANMYQAIGERINVIGVYKQARFIPKKFEWQGRIYAVDQVTFISEIRDSRISKRQYSVLSQGNSYRLIFDRSEEVWELAEVWCE